MQTQWYPWGLENQLTIKNFHFPNGNPGQSQLRQLVASFLCEDIQGWGLTHSSLSSLWLWRHCSLGWIGIGFALILCLSLHLLFGETEDGFLLFCWKNVICNQEPLILALNLPLLAMRLRASHFFKPGFSYLQSEGIWFFSIQKFCNSIQHLLDTLHLFEDSYQIPS